MNIKKLTEFAIKYLSDADYRFLWNLGSKKNCSIPDREYLCRLYKAKMGQELNLDNPISFNEKLQWLKLHDRRPEYTMMVDKYRVRDYIREQLGEEYLIPLLGVWDDPDDIDFDALPDQFVLKCNHNSGLGMCICTDKSKLNIPKVKRELRKGLAQDYYLTGREWPYKDVPRKIICEKYMTDESGELRDYKVHNFNGVPRVILVCSNRFTKQGLCEDFYNPSWEKLELSRPTHPNTELSQEQPAELTKMLELSKKLAADIPFARTDFYLVNGKLYFGEITFFPASGMEKFEPENWDELLGDWVKLPVEKISGGGYTLRKGNVCVWVHSEQTQETPKGLTDYKFFCFDGNVDCVMVCIDRHLGDTKFYFFDREWKLKRLNIRGQNAPQDFTLSKPQCIDQMFEIAAQLSKGLPFARIDLYECNGRIYFGEITFFPDSGMDPNLLKETDDYFGAMIKIRENVK